MRLSKTCSLAAVACVLGASVPTLAQSDVTLFGQRYKQQRFNYSQSVTLPNIAFPNDPPINFIESEGVIWIGNNKLLMSFDDIVDSAPGNPDNWVVEVDVQMTGTSVTGIAASRGVVISDGSLGFDLNPAGVTVNTGTTGLGRDGNVVVMNGDGVMFGYSFMTGALLQYPDGSGCTGVTCGLSISGSNSNAEDIAFVPPQASRPASFYVINQDTTSVERRDAVDGTLLGAFQIGGLADPTIAGAVPKGLAYVTDSTKLPASLRRPDGIILVAFDDNLPALQAFATDGTFIATQRLTLASGASILDFADCTAQTALQIESLTADPQSGRLFLSNQGAFQSCNYLYVLTPVCPGDFDGSGSANVQDIFDFLNAWFASLPSADVNQVDGVNVQDIFDFLNAWFAGC